MEFYQPVISPELYSGRKVSVRMSVRASSNVQLFIKTSAGDTPGTIHSGGGTEEILTATTTLATPETTLEFLLRFTALDTVYVDACTAIVGAGFTDLPFLARDMISDRHAIASMWQRIQWEWMVWAVGLQGGSLSLQPSITPYRTIVAGDITPVLFADPPGDTTITIGPWVSEDGFTFQFNSAAVGYAVNDLLTGDAIIDIRPT
jgi:hypothetical protein